MGEIVRAYLLKHPEIINEAMQSLRERQAAEAAAKTAQALKEHRDELLADPMSPVVGDPNGKVTVVEFFDYNCPYCRAAGPMVTKLLQGMPTFASSTRSSRPSPRRPASRRGRRSPPAVRVRSSIRCSTTG